MAHDAIDPSQYTPVQPHPDAIKDNILLVVSLHHQHKGEQPHSIQRIAQRWLETEEQPYERRLVVKEDGVPLDLGWYADKPQDIGLLVIENNESRGLLQNPDEETKADMELRIVELCSPGMAFRLLTRPGWSNVYDLSTYRGLSLRCQHGTAQCKIIMYPK